MTIDAKHMQILAGLSEVKSSTPKLSTAAEAAMSRRGMSVISCLGSSELAHLQDNEAKVHIHHSASARETHEVVSSRRDGGDLHGPGSSPSQGERVPSAD